MSTEKFHAVVLGAGESGVGAALLYQSRGISVFVSDYGSIAPKYKEVVQGKVEIRQVMKFSKALVAGSYVLEGKITNSSKIRILRDNIVAFDGELDSLRRFKDDVKEVAAGYECGITIKDYRDFQEGDIIEAYTMEEIETSITEANKEAAKRRDQQEQTKKDSPAENDA